MNILEMILNAQGGGAVRQMGSQFGLNEQQTQGALGALLPALAGAVSQNAGREGGMAALMKALSSGKHQQYLDDPSSLSKPEAIQDGNGILGHLLGSKDVSRALADRAAAQSGVGADILKKMLPAVAGMMMGGLSKQAASGLSAGGMGGGGLGALVNAVSGMSGGGQPSAGGGLLGMLTPLLDKNKDGSAMDDILGMASKFLGK